MDEIRSDVQAAEKKTAELQTAVDSAGRKNEDFTENKQLLPLAEQQTALGQRLEQLAANLAEHPLFAKAAAETEQVARKELQSARQQIDTAEQETDLARKRDFLGEAKEQLEKADQQLAEIGKHLDALAKAERDLLELNRLAEQAREMSRQLSELDQRPAPSTEQAGEKPAAEQTKRQEQMASLEDQQRDLAGKLGEMLSAEPAPSEHSPGGKSVPPEIAAQVAEALQKVQEAMRQLADSQGKPSSQSNGERPPDTGQKQSSPRPALAQCAQCMGQAAAALAKAAQQSQPGSKGMPQPGQTTPAAQQQDGPEGDKPGSNGTGNFAFAAPDTIRLDPEVQKLTGRRWGELPGHLQTEILQAAAKKPNGDYARLIKLYFKEIAQTRKPEIPVKHKD